MPDRTGPKTARGHRPLTALMLAAFASLSLSDTAAAQKKRESVLQIEVGDSIGLPLPDAKVEVFTFANGGVFWEWVPLGAEPLQAGINLLRFSYPGYEAASFSIPVREGGTVSLRVRLLPQHDSAAARQELIARPVNAIGLALERHAKSDVIGRRRVLERSMLDTQTVSQFGPLMRRARNTELTVVPASGGLFRVFSQSSGGGSRCPLQVMINGDRRRVLPFEAFDRLFSAYDVEVIEIFPAGSSVPLAYQPPRGSCGLMIAWFRTL